MTTLRALRVGIHASLGSDEDVLHVQQLVCQDGSSFDSWVSGDLTTAGTTLYGLWLAFFNSTLTPGTDPTIRSLCTDALVYDEMRLSLLEYSTPTTVGGKLHYADVVLPTVYVPIPNSSPNWAAGSKSTGRLPNEVALCLTELTTQRNRAARGRIYLGGLTTALMGADDALFSASYVSQIGDAFGTEWINGVHTATFPHSTSLDVAVVSTHAHVANQSSGQWYGPSALGIGGIMVGRVPDSQRRRRRGQDESRTLAWGSLPS